MEGPLIKLVKEENCPDGISAESVLYKAAAFEKIPVIFEEIELLNVTNTPKDTVELTKEEIPSQVTHIELTLFLSRCPSNPKPLQFSIGSFYLQTPTSLRVSLKDPLGFVEVEASNECTTLV